MSGERREPEAVDDRQVPYPSWTAIAAEVRRSAGPEDATPSGRQWQDLLAEEIAPSDEDSRDPR